MIKKHSIAISICLASLVSGPYAIAAPVRDQIFALPDPVSAKDLADMSGGASPTGIAISTQTLSALNSGNSVTAGSVVTGQVELQTGTFSGFNGIGNFVFNTGNNNNVQGTLSVTILAPAAN
jgi:hypothetical protein